MLHRTFVAQQPGAKVVLEAATASPLGTLVRGLPAFGEHLLPRLEVLELLSHDSRVLGHLLVLVPDRTELFQHLRELSGLAVALLPVPALPTS